MQNKVYRIDKGIKLTPIAVSHRATLPSAAALTLVKLDKGDSFLIKDELSALKATKVLRDFQKRERARKGSRVFTSRKVGAGVRIWRVR
jgi:hypothetical protein